jgi:hypothetical protein
MNNIIEYKYLLTDVTHRILSCQAAKLLTASVRKEILTLSGLTTLTGHPLRDAIHQKKQSGCVTSVNYMVVIDAIINNDYLYIFLK